MRAKRIFIWTVLALLLIGILTGCVPAGDRPAPTEPTTDAAGHAFAVHFIDVGQADAALVLCDGSAMLIDGGNVADSDIIYTYLKKMGIRYLDYIVATHAHEDHVGGLSGALQFAAVGTALSPVTDYSSKAFSNFVKYLSEQGKTVTVPKAGDRFTLGSAEVQVLGPVRDTDGTNNTSIVLRIVYGQTSFLFTGDAEREEEQDILDAGYTLSSTVLKVGHHGSETSTSYPFLREILPQYAVISVGTDNSYGHPGENTLSRLRDAGATVFRTDLQGDIICTSDGKEVTWTVGKNSDADTLDGIGPNSTQSEPAVAYVVNTNTGKFHDPSCSSAEQIEEANKLIYTGPREDLIQKGYTPCGKCKP